MAAGRGRHLLFQEILWIVAAETLLDDLVRLVALEVALDEPPVGVAHVRFVGLLARGPVRPAGAEPVP